MEAKCGVPAVPDKVVASNTASAEEESGQNSREGPATVEDEKPMNGISSVIPGWFFKISPLWPVGFSGVSGPILLSFSALLEALPPILFSFCSTAMMADNGGFFSGLGSTGAKKDKPKVVVLGMGWAGCRQMKGIDTKLYDVVCISPRNHMVFTPLLASTCIETLEFCSIAEPVS